VTVPLIGTLSDSIGRRRPMLLSCALDVLPFTALIATENMYVSRITPVSLARLGLKRV
jgi:MFS family permease